MPDDANHANSASRSIPQALETTVLVHVSIPGSFSNTPQPESSAPTSPAFTNSPLRRQPTWLETLFGSSVSQLPPPSVLWTDRGEMEDLPSMISRASQDYSTRPHDGTTQNIKEQMHRHCSKIIHDNHGGCSSDCQPVCKDDSHRLKIEVRFSDVPR